MSKNQPKPRPNDTGFLYHFGRGISVALLVFALPCWLAWRFFDPLNDWYSAVSDLPVVEKLQNHFHTGAELAGEIFKKETVRFYDLDAAEPGNFEEQKRPTRSPEIEWSAPATQRFWHRAEIENELLPELPAAKHAAVHVFLDYVEAYRPLALREMQRTKIPASITLAQGLLESDAGRSYLARKARNHFGIKCKSSSYAASPLAIDCLRRADDNPWDEFEVYQTSADSYRRHSQLLAGERYGWMIRRYPVGETCRLAQPIFGKTEVPYFVAWCQGLKRSGYATSKFYGEKLALIIETYQLWRLDYEGVMEE